MVVLGGKLREYKWIWWIQYKTWLESWCVPSFPWIPLHGSTRLVVLHGHVAMEYSRLKVLGSGQLFQRWLRHLFHSEKTNPKYTWNSQCAWRWRNPTCAKCAKLCRLRHLKFEILRSGKDFWVIKTLMKKGSAGWSQNLKGKKQLMYNKWRNHLGQCHPVALENLANNRPKGNNPTATIDRTNSWVRVPGTPWTPGSNISE